MKLDHTDSLSRDIWSIIAKFVNQRDRSAMRATSRLFFRHITPLWDQYIIDTGKIRSVSTSSANSKGYSFSLILTEIGELFGCGHNYNGELGLGHCNDQESWIKLSDQTNIRDIAVGAHHIILLTEMGVLIGCGPNGYGPLGLGHRSKQSTWRTLINHLNVRSIVAGADHSLLLTDTGVLLGCGCHESGQLGLTDIDDQTDVMNIVEYGNYDDALLDVSHLYDRLTWVKLSDNTIRSIAAGPSNSFALMETGELWGCGSNWLCELGLKHGKDQRTWVKLIDRIDIQKISVGHLHTLLLTEMGELLGCGLNEKGQLGVGHTKHQNTWIKLTNKTHIRAISASSNHSLFLTDSGELWGCGCNEHGQLGIENQEHHTWIKLTDITGIRSILAGSNLSFFITDKGDLFGCGQNDGGQLGLGHRRNQKTWVKVDFNPYKNKSCSFDELRGQRFFAFIPASLKIVLRHCEILYQQLHVQNDAEKREKLFTSMKLLIIDQLTEALPLPWDQEFQQLNLNRFMEFYNKLRFHFKLEAIDELKLPLKLMKC